MRNVLFALALAAAFAIGFLAGRATAPVTAVVAAGDVAGHDANGAASAADGIDASGSDARLAAPTPRVPGAPVRAAPPPTLSSATTREEAPPTGGPLPLAQGDLQALATLDARADADGGALHDLLELSRHEPRDEDTRRLEAMLAAAIRRLGDRYTRLRLAPPHCTASVCVIRGVGVGGTQDPRADWQRLSGALMNEPWFRDAFDDMHAMVGGEAGNTLYITVYARCAPGACRFGSGRR